MLEKAFKNHWNGAGLIRNWCGSSACPCHRGLSSHGLSCVSNVCKDPSPMDCFPPGRVSAAENPFSLLCLQSIKQSQSLYLVEKGKSPGKSRLRGRRGFRALCPPFQPNSRQSPQFLSWWRAGVGTKPLIQVLQIADFWDLHFFCVVLKKSL